MPVPHPRQHEDQRDAPDSDQYLQQRVERHRSADARAERCGEKVSQAEPGHETREHQHRGPGAAAEGKAGLAEPQRLEDQRRGARDEEDGAQGANGEEGHAGVRRRAGSGVRKPVTSLPRG